MSLQETAALSRDVPADTKVIGEQVLEFSNIYRQVGDHFNELLPEEKDFAAMYEPTGRGAISPLLMALVTIFQMLEKLPDRVAADYVVSRIDWKYALHLSLTYTGFHFTNLMAFRKRLMAHEQERQIFDLMLSRLQDLGLIKPRGQMRTDSTHLVGVVERLSQLELITESIRVALRAVSGLAGGWVQTALPLVFRETYAQPSSQYGLSEAEVQSGLRQAGQDGFWFLEQIERSAPAEIRNLAEVEVLRTVLNQQFPKGPAEPASKRPMGREIIESPHEPEARCGKKRGQTWIGYKVQVTETCDADYPHLIVDLEVTGALDNDSVELPHIQTRLEQRQLLPGEQQVDQGYMSGQNLVESAAQGIKLMGKPLADTQGPTGFRQTDFEIDEVKQQAVCPAKQISVFWKVRQQAGQPPAIQIRFAAETCRACPFFGQCTSCQRGRSLTLHPYRLALTKRRAEATQPEFLEQLHLRAGIEGCISELTRAHRLRWARYRGRKKIQLQAYFTAIAANLKRLIRWWTAPEREQVAQRGGKLRQATGYQNM